VATARFCTPLEERPNALNGGRRGDGPVYCPFADVAIAQVGIRRGKLRAHGTILAQIYELGSPADRAGHVPGM
jgi:hypothetical protein